MSTDSPDRQDDLLTQDRADIRRPRLYKVLLHNDDYTTMDFVVMILAEIFHKSINDAVEIMLNVHNNGIGIAGIYTREICESKIDAVHTLAEQYEYPLLCTMEIA